MTTDKITPIGHATRADQRRRHARSQITGRLFAIFDQLCTTARAAREAGEEYNDPMLSKLGGCDDIGSGSPLHDAMMAVCHESVELLRAAQPDDFPSDSTPSEQP